MKKFFRASNVVLLLLCAMYGITYIDRVNVSTAAPGFAKEFGPLEHGDRPRLFRFCLSVPGVSDHWRMGRGFGMAPAGR